MTREDALREIAAKAEAFDDVLGQPLHERDVTWAQRADELQARLNYLATMDRPSVDMLAAIGAQVVAFMRAVAVAEETRVEAGA